MKNWNTTLMFNQAGFSNRTKIKKKIFLTGATGVLGRHLLKLFLSQKNTKIILLIRGENLKVCKHRVKRLLSDISPHKKAYTNISIINGDLTKKNLGLNKKNYNNLCNSINEIYHCAALAEFRQPLAKVRLHNVVGTKNLLDFASQCLNISKFNYISTAFIAGTVKGKFSENDVNREQNFNNTYEQSKFEAEILARRYSNSKFSIAIFRPSIVVGEYSTGKTSNFRMFYQPFRTFSLNLLKEIPINPKTVLNIIPCDVAAKEIHLISQNSDGNNTYHIVSPTNLSILKLMKFARKYIGYKEPKYVDLKNFNLDKLTPFERKLIGPYIPYFNFQAKFEARRTFQKLNSLGFKYPEINAAFLKRLFKYSMNQKYIVKN